MRRSRAAGSRGITVEVDQVKVSDDDVDEGFAALRERFGSLVGVERAVAEGHFVSIDLSAAIADEEIDSVTGVSYEVGSGNMLNGMDDALLGERGRDHDLHRPAGRRRPRGRRRRVHRHRAVGSGARTGRPSTTTSPSGLEFHTP